MFEGVKKNLKDRERSDVPLWASSDSLEFFERSSGIPLPKNARVEAAALGGVPLSGRAIQLDHGPELFNHTAYSVLIDFCKEQEGDSGYLVTFDGSFSLSVGRDSLLALVSTDRCERRLTAGEIRFGWRRWYRLALTFSGALGRADLYLDGDHVTAATDLQGARQVGNLFANLYIGSPDDGSFSGRIDNFRFLNSALAQEDL